MDKALFYIHQKDNITAGELKKFLASVPDESEIILDEALGTIRFDNFQRENKLYIEQS